MLLIVLAGSLGLAVWHFWPRESRTYVQPVFAGKHDHGYAAWAAILASHVKDGRVDYAALQAEPTPLRNLLRQFSAVPYPEFDKWEKRRKLAFLINLYNATTVKMVVDHYPIRRFREAGGMFRAPTAEPSVRLFSRRWTLDELENDWIKNFGDDRVAAALCRATRGGPILRSEPYVASKLDAQLAEQASRADRGESPTDTSLNDVR